MLQEKSKRSRIRLNKRKRRKLSGKRRKRREERGLGGGLVMMGG